MTYLNHRNFKQTGNRVPGLLRGTMDWSKEAERIRKRYHPEIKYPATFRGKHNKIKAFAFMILYTDQLEDGSGLTRKQIAVYGKLNFHSLSVLLFRWHKWGFVDYVARESNTRYYFITDKGRRWLKRNRKSMPFGEYIKELKQIRDSLVYSVPGVTDY